MWQTLFRDSQLARNDRASRCSSRYQGEIECKSLDAVVATVHKNKPCKVKTEDDPVNLKLGWKLAKKDILITLSLHDLKNETMEKKAFLNTEQGRKNFVSFLNKMK